MVKRPLVAGSLCLLFAILGLGVWNTLIKDKVIPKRFGIVETGAVYRSGQIDPWLIERTLAENQIKTVIDLQYWEEKPGILAEQAAIEKLGLVGLRFPLDGNGTGNIQSYVSAVKALHKARLAGEPVLVHCAAGSQRTGGVLAAYRTLVQGVSAEDAVAEMAQFDWDPETDQILLDYLNEHIGYLAEQMHQSGIIDQVPASLPYFKNPLAE